MTSDDRARIEQLFLAAADLAPDEQARFLDGACDGQPAVRAEIESLLASERKGVASIEHAIHTEASALIGEQSLVGARLGAYRLLREIGRGGMGTVYLATRDDDEFHKQVALKVVKRGMDTDEVLRRFRRERQILANLEHPYVARLIDGGSTPDGRPFLVMEFVEGEPIDRYCAERGLSVADRCRLFIKVCEAVSHAHRSLVVHCDLKPGNILVSVDGTPKLLDFGVARILDPAADTDDTIGRLVRPLTPDYASPEQVRGAAASTATDVYSLGVVLYELLTGRRAHRITSLDPAELQRVICDTDLPTPSTVVVETPGSHRMQRQLAGDLDTIVLQATRKESARRYATVDQLAEDLRAHLESRPVSARRDSWAYRASRIVRRHRIPVLAATGAAVSLIAGTALALVNASHARLSEQRAQARLAQIVSLSNSSLSDVYGRLEHLPGGLPARKQLVSSTVDLLEGVSKEAGADPGVKVALAKAYLKLSALQGDFDAPNVGDFAGAVRSARTGASMLEPIAAARDHEQLWLWADLQTQIAKALYALGQGREARGVLQPAIAVVGTLKPTVPRSLAALYLTLARATGGFDNGRALELARTSQAVAEAGVQRTPGDTDLQMLLTAAYTDIGYLLIRQGDSHGAEAPFAESIRIREQLLSARPNDLLFRRYLRLAYEHFADLQGDPRMKNLGRPDLARVYYEKARPLEEADRGDPDSLLARYDYATFLLGMALIDVPPEGLPASLATIRQAATMFDELAAQQPGLPRNDNMRLSAYEFTGHRLLAMHRYREAIAAYERALALIEEVHRRFPGEEAYPAVAQRIAEPLARARALAGGGQ